MIIWAGTSNLDVGMIVEHYPNVILPKKKFETQTVPGRNGDIILPEGSFANYEQPYQVFLDAKDIGGLEQVIPKVVDWLLGHEGYQRLEDSYFPDVYRMAAYSGGAEFVSVFNEYGEGTLTFNCAPEKYFKMGERSIELTSGQILKNMTFFDACPIITITGSGNGVLQFNDKQVVVKELDSVMTIDVKRHKAYSGETNLNNKIEGDFEDLKLGRMTEISWSGGITNVSIIPRWWTI